MLKDYNSLTKELTVFEKEVLLQVITERLKLAKGRKNAVTNNQLIKYYYQQGFLTKIAAPRIRKVVEYIRHTKTLESLVGHSSGYYIAESPQELKDWLDTMEQRRNAINFSISTGLTTYKKMTELHAMQ
jgi:hypothetical protein